MKRFALLLFIALALPVFAADPLPSWNDGAAKQSIVDFVAKVTKGESQRLDGGGYEKRLEADLSV